MKRNTDKALKQILPEITSVELVAELVQDIPARMQDGLTPWYDVTHKRLGVGNGDMHPRQHLCQYPSAL
jgi:uncharacterized protein YijF (DUF1287 family)